MDKKIDMGTNAAADMEHVHHDSLNDLFLKANLASEQEKQVGVKEAILKYPREVFWAIIFALGLVMAGYDAQIISSLYGLSAFNRKFGVLQPDGSYEISAAWQTALGMGTPIGQITILAFAYPMEKFGRKYTYAATVACCIAIVFMQFFAPNLSVLCAGEVIAGMLWGGCVLMAPTYTSEITHNSLRGILEVVNNLGFLTGQFIANGVMDAVSSRTDQYAYKIPFAVQWVWPAIVLSLIRFAPESPYWLVRHGKLDEARLTLKKLSTKHESDESIEQRLTFIRQTDSLEKEMEHSSSYLDIFRGSNNRRTEICTMVYCIQIFSGIPLCMNYSTYFFEQAGLASSQAFSLSLGSTAVGFSFTCLSAIVLNWVGRRTIFNSGLYIVTILLLLIGFLDIAPSYETNSSIRWAQASLVLIWSAVWQASLGPIMYVFIGEVSSTKLRSRTIAFATAMQSVSALVFTIVMPYILNPTALNIRGKAGFIFGGMSVICSVWCYFRLPETKGRTFDEIDLMFHRRVPARKFASFRILEGIESKKDQV